jgi:hypothetical protein
MLLNVTGSVSPNKKEERKKNNTNILTILPLNNIIHTISETYFNMNVTLLTSLWQIIIKIRLDINKHY